MIDGIDEASAIEMLRFAVKSKASVEVMGSARPAEVTIALAGAIGALLGAIITAIVRYAGERQKRKIVIKGATGRSVEVPADLRPEEIKILIDQAREIDVQTIEVS